MGAGADPRAPVVTGPAGTPVSGSPEALEAAEAQAAAEAELLMATVLVPGARPEVTGRAGGRARIPRGPGGGARAARGGRAGRGRRQGQDQAQSGQGGGGRGRPRLPRRRRAAEGRPARPRTRSFGRPDPLPKSMLPEEVDKALRALGDDGTKVRGALERTSPPTSSRRGAGAKEGRARGERALFFLLPLTRILILRFGRQLIDEVLSTRGSFESSSRRSAAAAAERRRSSRHAPGPPDGADERARKPTDR